MLTAPFSISGSNPLKPGWGLGFALALALGLELRAQAGDFARDRDPALEDLAGSAPSLMLVGDSRAGRVPFEALAAAWSPAPSSGRVWSLGNGSSAAMLERLERLEIRPRTLVVAVSPLSVGLDATLREGRSGLAPSRARRLRVLLERRLFLVTGRSGPLALGGALGLDGEAELETGDRRAVLDSYLALFRAQPRPSEEAMDAFAAAVNRVKGPGTRVVLARLPVGDAMQVLEEEWGVTGMLRDIAARTALPVLDLNTLPGLESLRSALPDESHVQGDTARRLLGEELGRLAREGGRTP